MQKVVRDLSDALGWAETIHIVRKWGGRELRVPKKITHGDPLALALGYATARRLVETFGGDKLDLPSERNALLELRNSAILAAADAGETFESIGLRYGLTRQHTGYLVAQLRRKRDAAQISSVKETTATAAQSPANA